MAPSTTLAPTSTSNKVKSGKKQKENRKIPKPLIERKRRARINKSLQELEKLLGILSPEKKSKKSGKLEKADVLEVAVARMRELKSGRRDISSAFLRGFESCFFEVKTFFENNDVEFGQQIVGALTDRMRQQVVSLGFSPPGVIRHTKDVMVPEANDGDDQRVSSSTSFENHEDVFGTKYAEADSGSGIVWRPWDIRLE